MNIIKTDIDGVLIIEPCLFRDACGYFFESFSDWEFEEKIAPFLGHGVHFDYHIDEGVFVIDSIAREKTMCCENEKSDSPYPGLNKFVQIRSTSSKSPLARMAVPI